jgi:hypothetical protein
MYSSRSARGLQTPGHQEDLDAVVALWEPLAEREEYANLTRSEHVFLSLRERSANAGPSGGS